MFKHLTLVVAMIGAGSTVAAAQNPWTWHKALAAGKTIQIKTVEGTVVATPASGNEVEVVARKHGRNDVDIKVEENADGITICTVYNDDDDCDSRGGNHNHRWRDRDDAVDFEVKVPRGVKFNGSSVSGDVEATGLTADVSAASVSGNVRISTTGVATASSVSGSIRARMGSNNWEDLSFSTVSGNITLEMPQDLNATVRFNTVSGDFDSEWPITLTSTRKSSYGPRGGIRGTIGTGGRDLSVSTVSGNLELRKTQ